MDELFRVHRDCTSEAVKPQESANERHTVMRKDRTEMAVTAHSAMSFFEKGKARGFTSEEASAALSAPGGANTPLMMLDKGSKRFAIRAKSDRCLRSEQKRARCRVALASGGFFSQRFCDMGCLWAQVSDQGAHGDAVDSKRRWHHRSLRLG
ncbi:hypothetical protein IE81DRAFT_121019 [Ceraceosorus guamensis]|uniref:Uncharacterized protein n=1 Tax=Ceraceosorus guamensis TaxID=1522189 RepID=A0A316VYM9_9BASI|nr:hypothetical protein IE81DRAFT_121019 [Ceraceosorus guamensis]PWN42559.1 hypothetical protein IE81DRAFT_121019 [Ceraceosorus guamensis]